MPGIGTVYGTSKPPSFPYLKYHSLSCNFVGQRLPFSSFSCYSFHNRIVVWPSSWSTHWRSISSPTGPNLDTPVISVVKSSRWATYLPTYLLCCIPRGLYAFVFEMKELTLGCSTVPYSLFIDGIKSANKLQSVCRHHTQNPPRTWLV